MLEPKVFGDDRGFFFESFNAQDFAKAAQQVRALMFIERFVKDIDTRLDQLDAA